MLAPVLAALTLASCPATVVHYVTDVPRAGGVALPAYLTTLWDTRVNRSDRLVLWRHTSIAGGSITGRRIDRRGSFTANGHEVRFPSTGCWRLTIGNASIVARVVSLPTRRSCGMTRLEDGKAWVRPRSSGIWGGWPWYSTARLATHGHDGERNMKIPWWVRRGWGPSLEVIGTQLDGDGRFRQTFLAAYEHDGAQDQMVFPSIIDIPAPGCWLLRVQTAQLAGVLVVRAFDGRS